MCQNGEVPKIVDNETRRYLIAEALHRVASREGLERASMRTVAAEAQVSVGAVQREFATKEGLLRFALEVTVEEVTARLNSLQVGPDHLAFAQALRRVLMEFLPDDERRLAQSRIWVAFYARAAVDPGFADVLSELTEQTRTSLIHLLEYARDRGELAPGATPEGAAELLIITIDGIWMGCARSPSGSSLDSHRAAIESLVSLVSRQDHPTR